MADAPETLAAPCAAHVPKARVAGFCRANGVRKLSILGSALRPDFGPESDVDALVEFAPGRAPGLFRIAGIDELSIAAYRGVVSLPLAPRRCAAVKIVDDRGIEDLKIMEIEG